MITFINIVITILLAYIAYQNYKISRASFYIEKDKFRLDLFHQRHKVFVACQEIFSYIIQNAALNMQELHKFNKNSADSHFLFGKDIEEYTNEIRNKGLRLIQVDRRLNDSRHTDSTAREKLADEESKIVDWFINQINHSKKIFRKYLHFSIDKDPV